MRCGIEVRTSGSKQRTVPFIVAKSGITLNVVPAGELADGEDGRVLRRDLAADDRLQHRDEVRARDDRIDGELRHRAVAALAVAASS